MDMDKNALETRVTRRKFLKMAGIGTVAMTALRDTQGEGGGRSSAYCNLWWS